MTRKLTKEDVSAYVKELSKARKPYSASKVRLVFQSPRADEFKLVDMFVGTEFESKRFLWFMPVRKLSDDDDVVALLWIKDVEQDDARDIFNRSAMFWRQKNLENLTPDYLHRFLSPFSDVRLVETPLQAKPLHRQDLFSLWLCPDDPRIAFLYFDIKMLPDTAEKVLNDWRVYAAEKRVEGAYCVVQ